FPNFRGWNRCSALVAENVHFAIVHANVERRDPLGIVRFDHDLHGDVMVAPDIDVSLVLRGMFRDQLAYLGICLVAGRRFLNGELLLELPIDFVTRVPLVAGVGASYHDVAASLFVTGVAAASLWRWRWSAVPVLAASLRGLRDGIRRDGPN